MSVQIEKIEKNVAKLEIEVAADVFESCMAKSYNKNKGKFNIPGFRKGKAPRNVIERYYGEQALYEDAINFACAEAYDKAIDEHKLEPVDRPEIDVVKMGKGEAFVFTATVTLKPEVELGAYKGLEVAKEEVSVSDEDVDSEIKKTAERNAKMVNVEDRPVETGDTLDIDFAGSIDGVPFEGGTAQGYTLVIGSGSFIPGFEEQLVGASLGSEVDVNVVFPEDYHSADLAGKPALFKVKVNDIKVKQLPEINDEFASDVSEFETLADYKADVKTKLLEKAEHEAEHKYEDAVVKKAVDNATVDVPEAMVSRRLDDMLRQFDMQLRYQGMDLANYLKMIGSDESQIRTEQRDSALNDVKTQLVLEAVGKAENVEVSEEEYETELVSMAERYKQPVEEMKKHLHEDDIEYIKNTIVRRKTVELLVNAAV